MNLIHHKNLNIPAWYASSVSYQMANIGSEISRYQIWRDKRNPKYADLAFERALELIDLTITDPKNRIRLKEILRVRELLVGWKLSSEKSVEEDSSWQKYFDTYARAVNNQKVYNMTI